MFLNFSKDIIFVVVETRDVNCEQRNEVANKAYCVHLGVRRRGRGGARRALGRDWDHRLQGLKDSHANDPTTFEMRTKGGTKSKRVGLRARDAQRGRWRVTKGALRHTASYHLVIGRNTVRRGACNKGTNFRVIDECDEALAICSRTKKRRER